MLNPRTGTWGYNSHRLTKPGQWESGKMSDLFQLDIQMVGVRLWHKQHKNMDPPCLYQQFRLLVVMLWAAGYFLGTLWAPQYCCWPCPLLYYQSPLLMAPTGNCTMPQNSDHLKLVSGTYWVCSLWILIEHLWDKGDLHHRCEADTSAATTWRYHINMDQNLWGMFPTGSNLERASGR